MTDVKCNEPFNSKIKSEKLSDKYIFRLAELRDASELCALTLEHNPTEDKNNQLSKTKKEIGRFQGFHNVKFDCGEGALFMKIL